MHLSSVILKMRRLGFRRIYFDGRQVIGFRQHEKDGIQNGYSAMEFARGSEVREFLDALNREVDYSFELIA